MPLTGGKLRNRSTAPPEEASGRGAGEGSNKRSAPLSSSQRPTGGEINGRTAMPSRWRGKRRSPSLLLSPLAAIVQRRWASMGGAQRSALRLLIAAAAVGAAVRALDGTYQSFGFVDRDMPSDARGRGSSASSRFSVVVNTYRRPDMLRGAVRHYARKCGRAYGVSDVYVVWSEVGVVPPKPDELLYGEGEYVSSSSSLRKAAGPASPVGETADGHHRQSNVTVIRVEKDSLNSRFLPIDGLSAPGVFVVDDDVRVDCPSLRRGFDAWEDHPDSMVGYYPRLSSPPLFGTKGSDGRRRRLVYHTWPIVYLRNRFNMVLTKACFLHRRYFDLYSGETHPQEIRNHVDVHKNCEDIAMALLVANATRSGEEGGASSPSPLPVYVQGSISDMGLFRGISTGGGHFGTRSDCLTDLTNVYVDRGWGSPLVDANLDGRSWTRHFPGFWWQAQPSNFFEWLAFGNTLS